MESKFVKLYESFQLDANLLVVCFLAMCEWVFFSATTQLNLGTNYASLTMKREQDMVLTLVIVLTA